MGLMNVLSIVISYSATALLLWWVLAECGATPAAKILAGWKRVPPFRDRPNVSLLPLVAPFLPVPAPVIPEAFGSGT